MWFWKESEFQLCVSHSYLLICMTEVKREFLLPSQSLDNYLRWVYRTGPWASKWLQLYDGPKRLQQCRKGKEEGVPCSRWSARATHSLHRQLQLDLSSWFYSLPNTRRWCGTAVLQSGNLTSVLDLRQVLPEVQQPNRCSCMPALLVCVSPGSWPEMILEATPEHVWLHTPP